TPPAGCSAAAWDRAATYTADKQVSRNGHTWKAKWWTRGEEPGTTGEWGVWQDLGAC
ncbi:chitinase, partial [Streptomyces lunaelactis]|uniref:carbohydrate-binding protein n=1 Tax=Streptomyces lunaelactis TaxID=1535768 RepID=UPI001D2E52ED